MSDEEEVYEEEILEKEVLTNDNTEEEIVDNEEELVDKPEEIEEDLEVVERAKKYGHLSKEEWVAAGRDPDKYKTPEEFDKTGKVIEQLYSLKKKVDQRDREIQSLVEYQQRTAQREYERAKQDLETRLANSKDDMDMEGVSHYTKELVRLQDSEQLNHSQHAAQMRQSAQEAFIERNAHWFNDRNPDLKNRAVEIDNELKEIYPNATYDELAQKIETRMQYEHPERVLGTTQRNRLSVVPSRQSSVNKTSAGVTSVKRTFQGLSQDLKDAYSATKRIVESRGDKEYSMNDFIAQLKKDGEL